MVGSWGYELFLFGGKACAYAATTEKDMSIPILGGKGSTYESRATVKILLAFSPNICDDPDPSLRSRKRRRRLVVDG